jgi:hypothetical protein
MIIKIILRDISLVPGFSVTRGLSMIPTPSAVCRAWKKTPLCMMGDSKVLVRGEVYLQRKIGFWVFWVILLIFLTLVLSASGHKLMFHFFDWLFSGRYLVTQARISMSSRRDQNINNILIYSMVLFFIDSVTHSGTMYNKAPKLNNAI